MTLDEIGNLGAEQYRYGHSFKVGQFLFIPIDAHHWKMAKILQLGNDHMYVMLKDGTTQIVSHVDLDQLPTNMLGSFQSNW